VSIDTLLEGLALDDVLEVQLAGLVAFAFDDTDQGDGRRSSRMAGDSLSRPNS
jgi:hypothetical protein